MTIWKYLDLPYQLDYLIICVLVISILAPYFPGMQTPVLNIPDFPSETKIKLKKLTPIMIVILVISLVPFVPIDPKKSDTQKITITVEDEKRNPLANVVVRIEGNATFSDTTDENGIFEIDSTHLDERFVIRAEGYKLFRQALTGTVATLQKL